MTLGDDPRIDRGFRPAGRNLLGLAPRLGRSFFLVFLGCAALLSSPGPSLADNRGVVLWAETSPPIWLGDDRGGRKDIVRETSRLGGSLNHKVRHSVRWGFTLQAKPRAAVLSVAVFSVAGDHKDRSGGDGHCPTVVSVNGQDIVDLFEEPRQRRGNGIVTRKRLSVPPEEFTVGSNTIAVTERACIGAYKGAPVYNDSLVRALSIAFEGDGLDAKVVSGPKAPSN